MSKATSTPSTPHVVFTTPRKLPRAESLTGRVVVLDVAFASEASGGGFEKITKPLIDGLGERLAAWVDHHDHLRHRDYDGDARFVLCTKAEHGACPEMIEPELVARIGAIDTIVCHTDFDGIASAAKWARGGHEPYPGCDDDARAIDTRQGELSAIGRRFDAALRAKGRDLAMLERVYEHLRNGLQDGSLWGPIDDAAAVFEQQRSEARKLASGFVRLDLQRPLRGKDNRVLAREMVWRTIPAAQPRYDKTELLLLGQQRAPIALVVDGDTATYAAAFDSGVDFLSAFKLSGGMPTLVSVPAKHLREQLRALGVGEDELSLRLG